MKFAYPSQRFQDWLSQQWVIWRGRRFDPGSLPWLIGPFGNLDSISDDFIAKLAAAENLEIERNVKTRGLLASIDDLGLTKSESDRLDPGIIDFYENTAHYDLDLRIRWNPCFRIFGGLINYLYSNRLKQLDFPLNQDELSPGIISEVVRLRIPGSDSVKYTVWYRTLKSNGRVLFSGIYAVCRLPSGKACIKVIFPLPRGNATVILEPEVGADGRLRLIASGRVFGDPGFYFLLADSEGGQWAQYIRSFRERLEIFVDGSGNLRAEHALTLWSLRVVGFKYNLVRKDPEKLEKEVGSS